MEERKTDFSEVVQKIKANSILLPDFQRKFVWTDEEKQRKLIASVLAKMPIGSVLLLKSSGDEFASKMIGKNNEVNIEKKDVQSTIEYLLDGQQRITVLSNVFSDVIFEDCKAVKDLVSATLLRRFFLRIPKYHVVKQKKYRDLFGVEKLKFPYSNPEKDEPNFLTQDILEFIVSFDFKKTDDKAYNPFYQSKPTAIDNFCLGTDEDFYFIPLYLLVDSEKNGTTKERTLNRIIEKIAMDIKDNIMSFYDEESKNQRVVFLRDISDEVTFEQIQESIEDRDYVSDCLATQARDLWIAKIKLYLKSCLSTMNLTQIVVEEAKRDRAIDIYENLNLGGIALNTFDLIMARVAKVYRGNFYQRIVDNIQKFNEYEDTLVPDAMKAYHNTFNKKSKSYGVTMLCCDERDNEIHKMYINAFLNVLSLCSYNPNYEKEKVRLDYIKRNSILGIEPQKIDAYCDTACNGIDRAMFFFKSRCGIRTIKDIHYELIITLVAFIFTKDAWFQNRRVHDLLEAWYWAAIFSGEFDSDQNTRLITNLQYLMDMIEEKTDLSYIDTLKTNVFEAHNFSNQEFLLLKNAEIIGRYPKDVIRNSICQFLLALTYDDLFREGVKVCAYMENADSLEAHHVIPLGSVAKMSENTKQLRDNKANILNSPLNFIYITKEANNQISDMSVRDYKQHIISTALSEVCFSANTDVSTNDKIEEILSERFKNIQGRVKNRINSLITQIK